MSNSTPDPAKLDLIQMVQQARMTHDADALPSQALIGYWIEAKRAVDGLPPTPRTGQWVITTTLPEIDALWAVIKAATRAGQLGYKSKAATIARQGGTDAADRVIYVRTYDADDAADVERVQQALRSLGVAGELHYERDHKPQ
jgi:Domain of unknown function (DUF1917)